MSSHSSERTLDALEAQTPDTCHLLRLSLELRDIIYGMLLTTHYCTNIHAPNPRRYNLKFKLHTAILLVNKQVSTEAMRVLYHENDFVIIKTSGVMSAPEYMIPHFEHYSRVRPIITSPVLQIDITATGACQEELSYTQLVFTTSDGLESIINYLWWYQWDEGTCPRGLYPNGLSLILDFNFKAVSRYQVLSALLIRPWDKVSGVKELILKGDIKQPMREHLEKSNLEGPFPIDVAARLAKYNSLAEQEFEQESYFAARRWWAIFEEYFIYVSRLKPYRLQGSRLCEEHNELRDVLRKSYYMYCEGLLKLVKASLRHQDYQMAIKHASDAICDDEVWDCELPHLPHKLTPIMDAKFFLGSCLALTTIGKTKLGMRDLEEAAKTLCSRGSRSLNLGMSLTDLTEDLKRTVNNELIGLESFWRCGGEMPLWSKQENSPDWQVGAVSRSFWEWLELPEEQDVA